MGDIPIDRVSPTPPWRYGFLMTNERIKITVSISKHRYARLTALAGEREMAIEQFASEMIDLGIISLRSNAPRLDPRATNDIPPNLDGLSLD